MEEELTRLAYIEDPEDPEFVEINPIAILQGLINVMDLQIGKVIRVKRALALAGVNPEEVAMAIADTAKEFDERYMKMSVTEIEETMFRRMAEIDEIVRSHPKGLQNSIKTKNTQTSWRSETGWWRRSKSSKS